jgi:hypothetical protein
MLMVWEGVKRQVAKLEGATQSLRFRIEAIPKFTRRPHEKDGNGLILNGCIGKH